MISIHDRKVMLKKNEMINKKRKIRNIMIHES
jgi:hypothetical protein